SQAGNCVGAAAAGGMAMPSCMPQPATATDPARVARNVRRVIIRGDKALNRARFQSSASLAICRDSQKMPERHFADLGAPDQPYDDEPKAAATKCRYCGSNLGSTARYRYKVARLTPRYLAIALPVWPSVFIRFAVEMCSALATFRGRPN